MGAGVDLVTFAVDVNHGVTGDGSHVDLAALHIIAYQHEGVGVQAALICADEQYVHTVGGRGGKQALVNIVVGSAYVAGGCMIFGCKQSAGGDAHKGQGKAEQ